MKSWVSFVFIPLFFLTSIPLVQGYVTDFTPTISISEEYSDNLFLTDNDKEHDFITLISPGISTRFMGKMSMAVLSYDLAYSSYARNDENNTLRHTASLSSETTLSKYTTLNLSNMFFYTEDPQKKMDESLTVTDNSIRRGREPYYQNTANIGLTHQFGKNDSIDLNYKYGILENKDPDVEDNLNMNISSGLKYWLIPNELGLEMDIAYMRGEFDDLTDDFDNFQGRIELIKRFTQNIEGVLHYGHTLTDYGGATADYQIYDPSIGLNWTSSDKETSLSIRLGYLIQDREGRENDSDFSLYGDITKIWRYKRGSAQLTGSSGYTESYFGAENLGFDLFYQGTCQIGYNFSRRLKGQVSSSLRRDKYDSLESVIKDIASETTGGLSFQPRKWLSLKLDYSFLYVTSNVSEREYNENRLYMMITIFPDRPFRITF